jgi:hypothetical protein
MTEQTISGRLVIELGLKGISVAQVSRDTGIQYDTLHQILSGKVKAMGVDKFAAIWQAYPSLDAWHILTGQPSTNPCAEAESKLQQVRAIVL